MNNTNTLDHGELNISGRTNNINIELDRYKKQQHINLKIKAREARELKAIAKQLFELHGLAIISKFKNKFDEKELINKFDQMIKWEPSKFIKIAESFIKETN